MHSFVIASAGPCFQLKEFLYAILNTGNGKTHLQRIDHTSGATPFLADNVWLKSSVQSSGADSNGPTVFFPVVISSGHDGPQLHMEIHRVVLNHAEIQSEVLPGGE